MTKATDKQLTGLATTLATEARNTAGRLGRALTTIDAATGHLRASNGTGSSGGDISDPTFAAADGPPDEAAADRRRISHIILTQAQLSKELAGITTRWAPDKTDQAKVRGVNKANEDIWCTNCAKWGLREPKEQNRSRCTFCDDYHRQYDVLPDRILLDRRARTNRLSVHEIAAWLNRVGSRKQPKSTSVT